MKICCTGTKTVDIEVSVKDTHTPTTSCAEFTNKMFQASSTTSNALSEQGKRKGSECEKCDGALMSSLPEPEMCSRSLKDSRLDFFSEKVQVP